MTTNENGVGVNHAAEVLRDESGRTNYIGHRPALQSLEQVAVIQTRDDEEIRVDVALQGLNTLVIDVRLWRGGKRKKNGVFLTARHAAQLCRALQAAQVSLLKRLKGGEA